MDKAKIFVRVRGLNSSEKEKGEAKVVKYGDDKVIVDDKTYQLTGFGPEVSNDQFYKSSLQNAIIQGISKGINTGFICVGESKSGKSTSLGVANSPAGPGLVALIAASIFNHVEKLSHFVGVSYLNIYNDKFADLLNPADKDLKVKTQANLGVYVEHLSELSVKSTADLMRLYDQGNKVRKIVELEMNTPATKSHTIFTISCEYRNSEQNLVRSQIQFYNVAGLNHSKDQGVSNSIKSLETLISECASSQQPTGFSGSKLTQLLKSVMDKTAYLTVLGHVSPTAKSVDTTGKTLEMLTKCLTIQLAPKPNTLDTQQLIEDLRKRVAVARDAITSQSSVNIDKEHILELDNSLSSLSAAKRLQWDVRERESALAEEQRRETLADQGVLEWITKTAGQINNNSSSVLLLQKDKENLVAEYKKQREIVDGLKTELQSSISTHTSLAEQPNQSEPVLQGSLTKIHKLRDELKTGNNKLRDLKKDVKEAQDKLKLERTQSSSTELETSGNFALTLMMKKDQITHLKRDNQQFLDEEKERLQTDSVQETAEIKLSATQGNTLTLEHIVKIQEQHVQQGAQLSHLALHVQCLQAENEKLSEAMEALNSAHRVETETQKARNLLTFRQYKDFYEEAKAATNSKFQDLLNSCIQDCVFLSSKNAELTEENTELKRKLKHYN
ncbi:uncharacterized protein LOC134816076 [Bolinopsis microptera]|uniref:uncharacterized protein LOC134816076 n=1 Tax=Bolinopsis microptera TaxID=2820187 RepID=UPI00307A2AA3